MSNLTVRQEYAKAAMQAYIGLMVDDSWSGGMDGIAHQKGATTYQVVAEYAFGAADAMIRHEENEVK